MCGWVCVVFLCMCLWCVCVGMCAVVGVGGVVCLLSQMLQPQKPSLNWADAVLKRKKEDIIYTVTRSNPRADPGLVKWGRESTDRQTDRQAGRQTHTHIHTIHTHTPHTHTYTTYTNTHTQTNKHNRVWLQPELSSVHVLCLLHDELLSACIWIELLLQQGATQPNLLRFSRRL